MSGHTPGPWRFTTSASFLKQWGVGPDLWLGAFRDGDQAIALVARDGFASDESEANARLIAAAPDLLEACKAIVEAAEEGDSLVAGMLAGCAIHMAEAAIARATGAQP